MPFVIRLAATADTKESSSRVLVARETCRRIMSKMCVDVLKRPDFGPMPSGCGCCASSGSTDYVP